jgi:hypothetical protein
MAKTSDKPAGPPKADKTGEPPGFFAEENEFDRRSLLRIGTWGAVAVGAVVLAVISNQSSLGWHREQLAAGDLARQTQQIQQNAKESQNETRRLASAIDTLNNDRDRLYSRVTVLEQGLDSVTGAIAKQNTPPPAATAALAPMPPAATEPPAAPPSATPPAPQAKAQPAPPPKQQGAQANQQTSPPASQSPPPALAPVASAPAPLPVEPEKPRTDMAAKSDTKSDAKSDLAPAASTPAQFASSASALAATSTPPPLVPAKSMMGPPDPAAPKLIETAKPAAQAGLPAVAAATPPKDQSTADAAPNTSSGAPPSEVTVQHTDFAVDLGGANSVGGLRALWRGLVKSNAELAELRPIIVVKESTTGLGMQLRLAAGPLHDAAAAAKICAALTESKRACETTVFDGQRLAMAADDAHAGEKPAAEVKPAPTTYRHGYYPKRAKRDDAPPASQTSTLSSLLGVGKR